MPRQTKTVPDGHPRRLSDGRNAWRKMNEKQRAEFVAWIADEDANESIPMPHPWIVAEACDAKGGDCPGIDCPAKGWRQD